MNPGTPQKKLDLQPLQLAALLVLDGCAMALSTGANQLGGFLGLKREAEILVRCGQMLDSEKQKLLSDWTQLVKLVPLPAGLSVINGKKIG